MGVLEEEEEEVAWAKATTSRHPLTSQTKYSLSHHRGPLTTCPHRLQLAFVLIIVMLILIVLHEAIGSDMPSSSSSSAVETQRAATTPIYMKPRLRSDSEISSSPGDDPTS